MRASFTERGAVLAVLESESQFGRQQGYRTDEVIKIIENVG